MPRSNPTHRRLIGGRFVRTETEPDFVHPLGEAEDPMVKSLRRVEDNPRYVAYLKANPQPKQAPVTLSTDEARAQAICKDNASKMRTYATRIFDSHGKDNRAQWEANQARDTFLKAAETLKLADLKRPIEKRKFAQDGRMTTARSTGRLGPTDGSPKKKYIDDMYTSTTKLEFVHKTKPKMGGPLADVNRSRHSTDVTKWSKNILNHFWIYEVKR